MHRRSAAVRRAGRGRSALRRPACDRRPGHVRAGRLPRSPIAPSITCAAVTTSCGRATHPEPSTPSPHAVAVMRTTLGRTARTAADESARLSGGVFGGAGPAIDGNGSTRANARRTFRGGTIVFSRWRISEPRTSSRTFAWSGSCRMTAPATQTRTSPIAAPARKPPIVSSRRSGGITDRLPRATEPATDATLCSSAAPTSAPASAASGVYGESAPLCRKCGASRAPIIAPTTSPPSESAVAIRPRLRPASAERATIASAIQSARATGPR